MSTEQRASEVPTAGAETDAGALVGHGLSDSDPVATAAGNAESGPDPIRELIDELSMEDDFTAALKAWYQKKPVPPQWNEWQKIAYLLARRYEEAFDDKRARAHKSH